MRFPPGAVRRCEFARGGDAGLPDTWFLNDRWWWALELKRGPTPLKELRPAQKEFHAFCAYNGVATYVASIHNLSKLDAGGELQSVTKHVTIFRSVRRGTPTLRNGKKTMSIALDPIAISSVKNFNYKFVSDTIRMNWRTGYGARDSNSPMGLDLHQDNKL